MFVESCYGFLINLDRVDIIQIEEGSEMVDSGIKTQLGITPVPDRFYLSATWYTAQGVNKVILGTFEDDIDANCAKEVILDDLQKNYKYHYMHYCKLNIDGTKIGSTDDEEICPKCRAQK
jgi:hypothetical protein